MFLVPLVIISSCGGGDDAKDRRPERQAAPSTAEAERTRSQPSRQARDTAESDRVKRYLREQFGGVHGRKASWYDHVKAVEVSNGTTTVRTNIQKNGGGDRVANQVCTALIGSLPGTTDVVRVTGPPGGTLLEKCVP